MDSILPSQALPYQFKDPRQREIYESLNRLVSSGIAEYYKDACKLMDDPESSRHYRAPCGTPFARNRECYPVCPHFNF
jgi:hypothetical protein